MKNPISEDQSRRDFLKMISLAPFALVPTINTMAEILGISRQYVADFFSDDFHYFDNNLTSLHFYFINAKVGGNVLKKVDPKLSAYMVVKIPQQHISEEVIKEDEFLKKYAGNKQRAKSKISGFSYLSFLLFPEKIKNVTGKPIITTKTQLNLNPPDKLLNFADANYFELIIPKKDDIKSFNGIEWKDFKNSNNVKIDDSNNKPVKGYISELYKDICTKIFKDGSSHPITVLEIPEGLLVTPYSQDGARPLVDTYRIEKQRFIINQGNKRILRTVEEIWSAQMFFDSANGKTDPALRAVGYLPRKDVEQTRGDNECPTGEFTFLPTLLDKKELVYLTSLGRAGSESKDWNIETKGLTFTGLGAIAKFHYKNMSPPKDTDLAEYEHHISLGRDEYIKVARLGVISVTGQRAMHVKIGQRKVIKGESYMDFKEYIEIVQKEILYFDNRLFMGNEQGKDIKEPQNYLQARTYPPTANRPDKVIHSIDNSANETDNTYRDSVLWNLPGYLPGHPYASAQSELNWHTHYRRWPFKKVESVNLVSQPIETALAKKPTAMTYEHPGCDCASVFWPVLEVQVNNKDKDCYLEFIGYDWNNQPIKFSSTFLFIRKRIIECNNNLAQLHKEIYNNRFINQLPERRSIHFINQTIALTPDFTPGTSSENKSNLAKVDFLEYYFSLCAEPVKIIPDTEGKGTYVPESSIFNERFFPLYPQLKQAQVYLENIQSYSPEPLVSIIEYNDDFINFGYEGKKAFIDKGKQLSTTYNKGKLIFNHTADFISGKDQGLGFKDGLLVKKTELVQGYQKIRQAFSGAGDAIGALVNPDFDIQSIGLIKQSISVGKEINKKYEQLTSVTDKLEKFNPSDLLRQAPEIFNGISLLDILQEVFPDYEAPVNEIKNVAAKLEKFKDEIVNNPIYVKLKKELETVNKSILDFITSIEAAEAGIESLKKKLNDYKNQLNLEAQFADLENLVEKKITQYKVPFLKYENDIVNIASAVDVIVEEITTDLLTKTEIAYGLYQQLTNARNSLLLLKDFKINANEFSPDVKAIIQDFISNHYFNATKYIIIDLSVNRAEGCLRPLPLIKAELSTIFGPYVAKYNEFTAAVSNELKAREAYVNKQTDTILLSNYQKAAQRLEDATKAIKLLEQKHDFRELIKEIDEKIKKTGNNVDKELIEFQRSKFEIVQAAAKSGIDFINSFNLPFYIEQYKKAAKDFETIKSKLKYGPALLNTIIKNVDLKSKLKQQIDNARKKLTAHYAANYTLFKDDVNKLVLESNQVIGAYKYICESMIWDGLDPNIPEQKAIKALLGINDDLTKDILSIKDLNFSKINGLDINQVRSDIERIVKKDLKDLEQKLRDTVKDYELLLRKQVEQAANGIVGKLTNEIQQIKQQILENPDNQELADNFIKLNELYNLLTAVSKKEVNYDWQTSSFKNADFGIVSFIASSNPKTTLKVSVRSAINFEPLKFPAIVSSIESSAENRLNNFGISLLKAIIINFNEVSFIAGTNQKSKFEVKIRDVQFAGAFSFVQALESIFSKLLGDNFSVKIQPLSIEIQYLLPIAYLGAPSFGFKDILFKILYTLHFDKRPMELGVGIGTPENRTKLSVGVYTGLFYFIVIGNPKDGITVIEVSIEFGGYFGLNLGPLRGEVKLVVGLYYRKDPTGVIIEGYFLCEGRVKLWFVMVTARFYMGVRSRGSYVEGRCTVSYEIRISRFFKRSFDATYYKKLAGASPGNNQSGASQRLLAKYMAINAGALDKSVNADSFENSEERKTRPLTQKEWEKFINSYID